MKRHTPEFLALQRKQLDTRLGKDARLRTQSPKRGWIRAIRTALGMTAGQLGARLGMTRQGVIDVERRESAESISIGTLRKVAQGLQCDLIVALVPKDSFESIVRQQAIRKARNERNRVVHTMRLEEQEPGVDEALDLNKGVESWMAARSSRLWD